MGSLRQFFHINRALLPIKFHYGLYNGGTATVQPTLPVYAKTLRFSSFVVGTIYTVLPLGALLLKPIFCAIADRFKWHRGVLISWLFIVMTSYFSVQFIPAAEIASESTKIMTNLSICASSNSLVYFNAGDGVCEWTCPVSEARCLRWNLTRECDEVRTYQNLGLNADNVTHCVPFSPPRLSHWQEGCTTSFCQNGKSSEDESSDDEQDDATTFSQWQFWVFLLLLVASYVGNSVVMTIADTVCIEICGDSSWYGRQRLWGSMMWGIFSIIVGVVVDAVSTDSHKDYTPAFYIMLVPLLIDAVVFYFMKFEIPQQSKNIATDVWRVLLTPRSVIFMIWCCMVGVSFGLLGGFLYWFLEDLANDKEKESIKTIEGLVMGVETLIGETPAFFFGGWVVDKLGHGHSFTLILGIIGLRFTLYSILTSPWWCLPIEVLHNYYGLFYSTMTSYAKKIAPPGTEATIQSVLAAICEGIGMAVGGFVGGSLFSEYDGATTFEIFGIAFLIMAAINEGIELIFRVQETERKRLL